MHTENVVSNWVVSCKVFVLRRMLPLRWVFAPVIVNLIFEVCVHIHNSTCTCTTCTCKYSVLCFQYFWPGRIHIVNCAVIMASKFNWCAKNCYKHCTLIFFKFCQKRIAPNFHGIIIIVKLAKKRSK